MYSNLVSITHLSTDPFMSPSASERGTVLQVRSSDRLRQASKLAENEKVDQPSQKMPRQTTTKPIPAQKIGNKVLTSAPAIVTKEQSVSKGRSRSKRRTGDSSDAVLNEGNSIRSLNQASKDKRNDRPVVSAQLGPTSPDDEAQARSPVRGKK